MIGAKEQVRLLVPLFSSASLPKLAATTEILPTPSSRIDAESYQVYFEMQKQTSIYYCEAATPIGKASGMAHFTAFSVGLEERKAGVEILRPKKE